MLNLLIAGLILPLVASLLLFRRPRRPLGGWLATFILAAGMVLFGFFTVPWALLSMPLRYVMAAVFLISAGISMVRKPDDRAEDSPTRMMLKVLIGLFFGSVALGVMRAHSKPPDARDLAFPLTRGPYHVVHGGSTNAANTYFGRGSQGFAVEVVGMGPNEPVVSPCDGTVTRAKPYVMTCGDMTVILSGADGARTGAVRRGETVGRMNGPQLLIYAERNKQPVPITFNGRWLVRNMTCHPERSEGPGRAVAR